MNKDELQAAMLALPELKTDKKPPYWEYWRWELWQHVTNGDDPARFWEWPCIYHTMLQNHWLNLIEAEAWELVKLYPTTKLHPWLSPPDNGPVDFISGKFYSANLIKQLYHLTQWEQTTGKQIADLHTIVEFGGGYGAMALLVHRLGFKGTYYILDLPEFALLQEYYLSNTGEQVNVKWELPKRKPKVDLFMALYSLSEVAPGEREAIINKYKAASHLFLYSNKFAGYDNKTWFSDYAAKTPGKWKTWVIEHMPPESLYSVGW